MTAATRVLIGDATTYTDPARGGSHAFAEAFASAGAKVCWVGTPITPAALLWARRSALARHRASVWMRGGAGAGDVTEYYPLALLPAVDRPVLRTRFALRRTLGATLPPTRSALRALGFDEPDVLWLGTSRFAHALAATVRPRVRVCRVSDDWDHFGRVPAALRALHDETVDTSDVVFAVSRRVQTRLGTRRPDAIYLPNGVADAFFRPPDAAPAMLARYPHPRVVVVGRLDAWVDFDAIAQVGERNPRASVLVVGPGQPASRAYPANVHFTGAFPYRELPALLRACDVGLVPFVANELTHGVSPLKLFEYLAAGLPVVATRLDEIAASSPPALLCDSGDAFAEAVASVLDGDPAGRAARVEFAREHTWARRFDVVRRALRERGVS